MAFLIPMLMVGVVSAQGQVTAYQVQPGDTLGAIARQFCTTWDDVYYNNQGILGDDPSVLRPGVLIYVTNRCPQNSAAVTIVSPQPGAVLPNTFAVSGIAQGAHGNHITIQVRDAAGNLLGDTYTTVQGQDSSFGAPGIWSARLAVGVAPGTPGMITVMAGGSTNVVASVNVIFGNPAPPPTAANSSITRFTVDRQQINPGECVTFYWNTANASGVYFYREGEYWQDKPVDPNPSHFSACPRATSTHFLYVVDSTGLAEIRTMIIWVGEGQRGGAGPGIPYLAATPNILSAANRCTNLAWTVAGQDVGRVILFRSGQALLDNVSARAYQDCLADSQLSGEIVYELRVENQSGSWTSRQIRITAARGDAVRLLSSGKADRRAICVAHALVNGSGGRRQHAGGACGAVRVAVAAFSRRHRHDSGGRTAWAIGRRRHRRVDQSPLGALSRRSLDCAVCADCGFHRLGGWLRRAARRVSAHQ
ncbi:MAG: Gmad2 immunoglobulin-like domain-containing protein [Caldilineaceae bacterium]